MQAVDYIGEPRLTDVKITNPHMNVIEHKLENIHGI